jgi:hypothetical protein
VHTGHVASVASKKLPDEGRLLPKHVGVSV